MKNRLCLWSEGLAVLFEGPFILSQMITSNSLIHYQRIRCLVGPIYDPLLPRAGLDRHLARQQIPEASVLFLYPM